MKLITYSKTTKLEWITVNVA